MLIVFRGHFHLAHHSTDTISSASRLKTMALFRTSAAAIPLRAQSVNLWLGKNEPLSLLILPLLTLPGSFCH